MAHHHPLLLLSSSRPSQLLKPLLGPLLLTSISRHMSIKMYSKSNKDKDEHEIGEKGRSTAEEFVRVAKEKEESVRQTQSSHKTFEVATVALVDDNIDTELAKETYKKKGHSNFDHIGQD